MVDHRNISASNFHIVLLNATEYKNKLHMEISSTAEQNRTSISTKKYKIIRLEVDNSLSCLAF